MKDSTTLWLVLLQFVVLVAVNAILVYVSSFLGLFLFGCIGSAQFISGLKKQTMSFLPVFGRTVVESRRNPRLFAIAFVMSALITLALLFIPILSWLHLKN
jgi:hypothetical protein